MIIFLIIVVLLVFNFRRMYFSYDFKRVSYDFTLIFGKKGSGKTSFMTMCAQKYHKYGITVLCTEPDIDNTFYLDPQYLGKYWLPENTVLLIDELSVMFNSRDFKNTSKDVLKWFKYSRHNKIKVIAFTQVYDDSDKQIRNLADKLYVAKNMGAFATYRRINKVLTLKVNDSGTGEIIDSFEYTPILRKGSIMFCSLKKWRKHFDSFSRLPVPDLPANFLVDNYK